MARHPLAQKLRAAWINQNATAAELRSVLHEAQLDLESRWDAGQFGPIDTAGCATRGCNYRRYPASKFCLYHSSGNDTLGARLRRAEAKGH